MDSPICLIRAAGEGRRLDPITRYLPKPLCPIDGVPMIDRVFERLVEAELEEIYVNVHFHRGKLEAHLHEKPCTVIYEPEPNLGSLGTLHLLEPFRASRPVLMISADSWFESPLVEFLDGWSGEKSRLWVCEVTEDEADWNGRYFNGVALLPDRLLSRLPERRGDLFDHVLLPTWKRGDLEVIVREEPFQECGTLSGYLEANLASSKGRSVVGAGAVVRGSLTRSIVWAGGTVHEHEHLVDSLRIDDDITIELR